MHPHPLLLVAAHVYIAQDAEEGEGEENDGGVATAMEGVQLSDRGGGGGGLPGPSGAGAVWWLRLWV